MSENILYRECCLTSWLLHESRARIYKQKLRLDEEYLATLPAETRQMLEMRYVGELSYHEIAEKAGLAPGTIRAKVSHAMREYEKKLAGERRNRFDWDFEEAVVYEDKCSRLAESLEAQGSPTARLMAAIYRRAQKKAAEFVLAGSFVSQKDFDAQFRLELCRFQYETAKEQTEDLENLLSEIEPALHSLITKGE